MVASWYNRRKDIVSLSVTEAKYIASCCSNQAACNEGGLEQSNGRCVSILVSYRYPFKLVCTDKCVVADEENEEDEEDKAGRVESMMRDLLEAWS